MKTIEEQAIEFSNKFATIPNSIALVQAGIEVAFNEGALAGSEAAKNAGNTQSDINYRLKLAFEAGRRAGAEAATEPDWHVVAKVGWPRDSGPYYITFNDGTCGFDLWVDSNNSWRFFFKHTTIAWAPIPIPTAYRKRD